MIECAEDSGHYPGFRNRGVAKHVNDSCCNKRRIELVIAESAIRSSCRLHQPPLISSMEAPSFRISGMNCGKLVAIGDPSLTEIGDFAARPRHRKLMAMR